MHLAGGVAEVPVYDRAMLGAGDRFAGPAIITQLDATTFVAPGWSGEVHASGALLLTFRIDRAVTAWRDFMNFDRAPEFYGRTEPRHD